MIKMINKYPWPRPFQILCFIYLRVHPLPHNKTRKFPKCQNYQIFTLKGLYRLKYFTKLYQTCNVQFHFISFRVCQVWTGNREGDLAIALFLKNLLPLKILLLLQFLQQIPQILHKHSWSRISEFTSQIFWTAKSQNFVENLTLKNFEKKLIFFGVISGKNLNPASRGPL